jgi:hypothetical protein
MKTRVMSLGPPTMIVFPLSAASDVTPFFPSSKYGALVPCSTIIVIGAPPWIASTICVDEISEMSSAPAVSCCAPAAAEPV